VYNDSEGTIKDRFQNIATHPASEATRKAVVGAAFNKKGRLGAAMLVAPRLVLLTADAMFEGEQAHEEAAFRVQGTSTAIVRAWQVGNCALAEL
jgi:hypothetical protein